MISLDYQTTHTIYKSSVDGYKQAYRRAKHLEGTYEVLLGKLPDRDVPLLMLQYSSSAQRPK